MVVVASVYFGVDFRIGRLNLPIKSSSELNDRYR